MSDIVVGFCLDETGSMGHLRDVTISGFNEYVGDLKRQSNTSRFSLTLFSDVGSLEPSFRPLCEAAPIGDVPDLSGANYVPRGNTPLYDAIGHTIHKLDKWLADNPSDWSVLFVIQTDGLENASREYTRQDIFDLIRSKEQDEGWRFVYLGADQDVYTSESAAGAMGMSVGSTMSYAGSTTQSAFASLSRATMDYAEAPGMTSAEIAAKLKAEHERLEKEKK